MQIVRSLDQLPPTLRGGAVTIGNFDGVHLGHARIVERLVAHARDVYGPAIVFTFDPHPRTLLRPEVATIPLTGLNRKAELLERLGVAAMVVYPTDQALLELPPEVFFARIVREKLAAAAMVEGPNFQFGKNRAGTVESLRTLCQTHDIALEIVQPLTDGEALVSTSRVRDLIQAGQVREASSLLTQPFQLCGTVEYGAERGRTIGFPTANLHHVTTVIPAAGVYAARAWFSDRAHPAAVNIGPNPTFGEQAFKIEVHLLDYSGNLYGEELKVDFLDHLRDIHPFASVDLLVAQLRVDVARARETFDRWSVVASPEITS